MTSDILIALTPYVVTDTADLRRVAETELRARREFIEHWTSFDGSPRAAVEIDYRLKRGMLGEIDRTARELDDEDAAVRRMRPSDLDRESLPIEIRHSPTGSPPRL